MPAGKALEGVVDAAARKVAVAKRDPNELVLLNALPRGRPMGLIDVRKNDLTIYDTKDLNIVGSVPAGDAVPVFEPPPTPHQVGEVAQPGGPYGIASDPTRDLLWVASSGTDEVLGYDMSQPTPREVRRVPTLQNPYALGVDAQTGRPFIAGVTGGAVQVVDTQS